MKNAKITVASLMSLMLVGFPLVSCSSGDNYEANQENVAYQALSKTTYDWYSYIANNHDQLDEKFTKGFTQTDLEDMLVDMGYDKTDLTLTEFNQIYSTVLNQSIKPMDFDKMFEVYYSDRSSYFFDYAKELLLNNDIDKEIGSTNWNTLSIEDQNLLAGLNDYIKANVTPNANPANTYAKTNFGYVNIFGIYIDLDAPSSTIAFWTFLGAGAGFYAGGPVGAAIGAGIGAVVGVVMAIVK